MKILIIQQRYGIGDLIIKLTLPECYDWQENLIIYNQKKKKQALLIVGKKTVRVSALLASENLKTFYSVIYLLNRVK